MSNHNFEQEISQAKYKGLHIQEGDLLDISVTALDALAVKPFNKTTMNQTSDYETNNSINSGNQNPNLYQVNSEGEISFPVIGSIYCKGMTKQQLKDDLESHLKKYLTDPMVSIRLTNFNISILGEVVSPGQKSSSTEKINIFQALALAGDMTADANRTNVKLIRTSDSGEEKVIVLDVSDAAIVNSPYYYLQQNDILYIEPDKNKQIAVNNNANIDKVLRYGGIALGLLSLILTITRLK